MIYLDGLTASAEGYSIMMMLEGRMGWQWIGDWGRRPQRVNFLYSCNNRRSEFIAERLLSTINDVEIRVIFVTFYD